MNGFDGNNVYDLIYDQTKMREHLIACFEKRKITTFLLDKKCRKSSYIQRNIFTMEQVPALS